jgi:hypothetical protein
MVTNDIAQDIERLIQLQQVYKEVFQLEKIKRELPLNPEQVKEGLADLEDEVQGIAQELDTVESEMKRNNVDIDTLKDRIAKIREQQKIVQSPKEFAYLDTQEKLLKDEIVELEKENKERGKEITELQTKLDEKKKDVESQTKETDSTIETARIQAKEIEGVLEEKQILKGKLSKSISVPILRDFERIANGKDGVGMVPVEGTFCTGCNISLPPRIVSKVRRRQEIVYCQNCARILYWKN